MAPPGFIRSWRVLKAVALMLADECIRLGSFIRAVSDVVDDPEQGEKIAERANEIQTEHEVTG